MAVNERTAGEGGQGLLDRLQRQIDRLEQIEVSGEPAAQLREVIEEMKRDAEDLKVVAPFVFIEMPPR